MPIPNKPEQLLHARDVAAILNVSMSRLEKWRSYGGGPDFIKMKSGSKRGGAVRYEQSAVDLFIAHNRVKSPSRGI